MRKTIIATFGAFLAAPGGLGVPGAAAAGTKVTAVELLYRVQEETDTPAYRNRVLVTPGAVRMDDGSGGSDFVLYDRKSRVIYSVSRSDKTVFVVDPPAIRPRIPETLELAKKRREQTGSPSINGVEPVELDFLANGELCFSAAVLPGMLSAAREALGELHATLALQQAASLPMLPLDAASPCELATNVYAPGREYPEGLPVRVWDPEGRGQELLDFSEGVDVEAALFRAPPDYRRYSMGDVDPLTAPR